MKSTKKPLGSGPPRIPEQGHSAGPP